MNDAERSDRTIRVALWASVVLNALGVVVLAPLALGRVAPLFPVAASPYLAGQLVFTIALFGVAFAWLALQPRVHRPLVVVAGAGKLGFFALAGVYALAGELPVGAVASATPDLLLGVVFVLWARGARHGGTMPAPLGR